LGYLLQDWKNLWITCCICWVESLAMQEWWDVVTLVALVDVPPGDARVVEFKQHSAALIDCRL
ncbi:hypothetical protein HAX54_053176, partial [Datura stramonium]|nr:hypothetical protein [Datura stramonium]